MNVSYEGAGRAYCDVAAAGEQLYFSGLISADLETGMVINGTIEEETERVMCNLETMLKRYGSSMDKIVRLEIFLTDFSERDRMNEVYVKHFPKGKLPARLCVGTTGLAGGCRLEIMAHACR